MTPRRRGDIPPERRAIAGRTWQTTYRMEDYDPIERPPRRSRFEFAVFLDVLLAVLIGLGLALALYEWWTR